MNPPSGLNLIFHTIRPGGGMERYVIDLIGELASRGLGVRVIARKIAWPDAPPAGVEFVQLTDKTPFSRINNLIFENTALQHCNQNWKTISISRVRGAVDMAIVGGTHQGHLQDKGKSQPGFFDRKTIRNERELYAGAGIIVSHSSRVRDEIIRHYQMPPERVVNLYPPVDTQTFSLDARAGRDDLRKQIGVKPGQFMLLFPSNNHELKGAQLILQALEQIDADVVLAVAGKAPLQHSAVINLGYRTDMPALYAAADATILASKYEAFGLVGPESILCGTPVLLANTVGATEVLTEPGCFCFERNTESLLACLQRLVHLGQSPVTDLDACIAYPYSLQDHVDTLLKLLAQPA